MILVTGILQARITVRLPLGLVRSPLLRQVRFQAHLRRICGPPCRGAPVGVSRPSAAKAARLGRATPLRFVPPPGGCGWRAEHMLRRSSLWFGSSLESPVQSSQRQTREQPRGQLVASLWDRWNRISMTARAIILTVVIVLLVAMVSYWTEYGSPFESQKEKD